MFTPLNHYFTFDFTEQVKVQKSFPEFCGKSNNIDITNTDDFLSPTLHPTQAPSTAGAVISLPTFGPTHTHSPTDEPTSAGSDPPDEGFDTQDADSEPTLAPTLSHSPTLAPDESSVGTSTAAPLEESAVQRPWSRNIWRDK